MIAVDFHPEAFAELWHHASYYDVQLPGLGDDFLEVVQEAARQIAAHRRAWPLWPRGRARRLGVRSIGVARFPFRLPYAIDGDVVTILAVAHTRRRPAYWLERVPT